MFEYLGRIAPRRKLALDCGTGSGQAAAGLAAVFDCVIATDASENQIANAQSHDRVEYRVAPAENSSLESETIDLLMVALVRTGLFLCGSAQDPEASGRARGDRLQPVADLAGDRSSCEAILLRDRWPVLAGGARARGTLHRTSLPVSGAKPAVISNECELECGTAARLPAVLVVHRAVHRRHESQPA